MAHKGLLTRTRDWLPLRTTEFGRSSCTSASETIKDGADFFFFFFFFFFFLFFFFFPFFLVSFSSAPRSGRGALHLSAHDVAPACRGVPDATAASAKDTTYDSLRSPVSCVRRPSILPSPTLFSPYVTGLHPGTEFGQRFSESVRSEYSRKKLVALRGREQRSLVKEKLRLWPCFELFWETAARRLTSSRSRPHMLCRGV